MSDINNMSVDLGKRQLVDSIWKSAGIEGLGTTFPNTERILENISVETKRDEVLFIVNMKRAWEFLFENLDYPTNLMFLRELNKLTLDGLAFKTGELRTVPVTIGGTSWVPDMPNEDVIREDLANLRCMENKLDSAIEFFCYIARSQMFIDGNKRLAQLVANKVMMENDLGIISVPYDRISEFKELLVDFYETNDNSKFKSFLLNDCVLLTDKGNEERNRLLDEGLGEGDTEQEPRI